MSNKFIVVDQSKLPTSVDVWVTVDSDSIEVMWGSDGHSKRVSNTKELDEVIKALNVLYGEEEDPEQELANLYLASLGREQI